MTTARQAYYDIYHELRRNFGNGTPGYMGQYDNEIMEILKSLERQYGKPIVYKTVLTLLKRNASISSESTYPSILHSYVGYINVYL